MSETVVLTILALLIRKGLKTSTLRSYICAMRNEHKAKGYITYTLDNCELSKDILKGSANRESTSPKLDRALVDIKMMRTLKKNLQCHPEGRDERKMALAEITLCSGAACVQVSCLRQGQSPSSMSRNS